MMRKTTKNPRMLIKIDFFKGTHVLIKLQRGFFKHFFRLLKILLNISNVQFIEAGKT